MSTRRHRKQAEIAPAASGEAAEVLPVPAAGAGRGMPLVVGAALFLVFLRTLAPAMHFGDGLELATTAYVMGVPHPTGYPIYSLLLKLATLLPLGEVITRAAMFSAVCMSACGAVGAVILFHLMRGIFPLLSRKALLICAGCGGAAAVLLQVHWTNAVVAEVYGFQLLLTLVFLRAAQGYLSDAKTRWLVIATAAFGLGLAHHRLSVTMGLPWVLLWVLALRAEGFRPLRRAAVISAAVLVICVSSYGYLMLRAGKTAMNWGNPSTVSGLVRHARGSEYLRFYFMRAMPDRPFTAETYGEFVNLVAANIMADFTAQFYPATIRQTWFEYGQRYFRKPTTPTFGVFALLAAFGVAGLYGWLRQRGMVLLMAGLIALQNLAILFVYTIADIHDYYLFPFWLGWIFVFLGLTWAVLTVVRGRLKHPRPEWAYVAVIAPALLLTGNWRRSDASGDFSAEDLSYLVLPKETDVMPENSILLTGGDHDIFTCWYRQQVRRERRDVLVFGSNFIYQPWYPSFFTKEQQATYNLGFAPRVPYNPSEFAGYLSDLIIDRNIGKHPIFTSTTDVYVLQELSRRYRLHTARQGLIGGQTTATLYRIEPSNRQ